MWGRIPTRKQRKDDEEGDLPPHKRLEPGYILEASILVLQDNMQGFFKAILGKEEQDAAARRQKLLTFVEDGKVVIEQEGVTYEIHSPTMIIGCDNENPFVKHHSVLRQSYAFDHAMSTRFVVLNWEKFGANTPTTRRGSLHALQKSVQDFNDEFTSDLELSDEAKDWLLVNFTPGNLLRLDYRSMKNSVYDLLSFAKVNGKKKLTMEEIIAFRKEKEDKLRFWHVDRQFQQMICDLPTNWVGNVFGIGVYDDGSAELVGPIKSGHILETHKPGESFQHVDIQSDLQDETAHKGFIEAADYVKGLFPEPPRFTTKSVFSREYGGAGPSASTAIAISICSALSGIPVNTNTAITGALSFTDGTVDPIGGVYEKALAIWKAQQHLGRPMRFIFPADNYPELRQKLQTSPYPIEQDLEMIAASNFDEAFYLSTASTIANMSRLPRRAKDHRRKMKKALDANVKKWNKIMKKHAKNL
jgi:hypothetical protein